MTVKLIGVSITSPNQSLGKRFQSLPDKNRVKKETGVDTIQKAGNIRNV